jgi:hypothetical protein
LGQYRTPSRSADLNLIGSDVHFIKTPRQGDDGFQRRISVDDGVMGGFILTPKPPNNTSAKGDDADAANRALHMLPLERGPSRQEASVPAPFCRAATARDNDNKSSTVQFNAADIQLWLSSHDYRPRDIAFNADGTMIGATLEVLVEKMTPHDTMVDLDFWETFFLTFRLFTTPQSLLKALELRYELSAPQQMPVTPETMRLWNERKVMPVRLRIFNLLKTWLESYWRNESDDCILDALILFIEERLSRSFPSRVSASPGPHQKVRVTRRVNCNRTWGLRSCSLF